MFDVVLGFLALWCVGMVPFVIYTYLANRRVEKAGEAILKQYSKLFKGLKD